MEKKRSILIAKVLTVVTASILLPGSQLVPAVGPSLVAAAEPEVEGQSLPILTDQSGLSDYLLYAALSNPELEAAFNRWKAALQRIPQAKSLPDPRFSYRYFMREIETRVGPQRQAFEISQAFPWFGKLSLAGDVAAQVAMVEHQRYEATKLRVFYELKHAYYEYYYLAQSIAVARENIELLKHLESVARTRYKTASGSHPDVIRAQVELGKLEDRLNSLRDLRDPIVARLNAALNRPVDAALPSPGSFDPSAVSADDQELLLSVERLNPKLRALSYEAMQHQKSAELARKKYSPDITFGLNYIDVDRSDRAARFGDNGRDAVAAMISLNIPIWHNTYSAAESEAKLRRHAAMRQRVDTTNKLKSELKMALYQLRDAKRKLDLYGNALLPKAEESLKVTEQSFRTGDGSFLDLIDAQRTYLEFELAKERALVDHEQAVASIEMIAARDITSSGNEAASTNVENSGTKE
jgi:outer membrane protein TolC